MQEHTHTLRAIYEDKATTHQPKSMLYAHGNAVRKSFTHASDRTDNGGQSAFSIRLKAKRNTWCASRILQSITCARFE